MARVGHLIRRKQQEIERITRILRAAASFEGVAAPVPGEIQKIVLIGPYARRTWYEDKASLYFSDYEFWVVVNHTIFADDTRWCRAKAIIARELGNRCAVSLSLRPERASAAAYSFFPANNGRSCSTPSPLTRYFARCASQRL